MKVLITGANGLLGVNVATTLYRNGYDIRIMVRHNADLQALSALPCEIKIGNINDYEHVMEAVSGCDVVVHTASVTNQWGVPAQEYEKVNITGTEHIIEACLLHNIKRLIYISTANTMAPGTMQNLGNELGGFSLFSVNTPYINTKYIAQQKVLESVAMRKLPAVVINPTFMIGANDSKPSSGQILLYALHKRVLFYPPGGKNFVHVQDVCDCISAAITANCAGECFLTAGENMSYKDFFKKTNNIIGNNPVMLKIPGTILLLGGLMGSVFGGLIGKRLKLNYATARLLCMANYYSGQKAASFFKLTYRPVDAAIKDALAWFKTYKFS